MSFCFLSDIPWAFWLRGQKAALQGTGCSGLLRAAPARPQSLLFPPLLGLGRVIPASLLPPPEESQFLKTVLSGHSTWTWGDRIRGLVVLGEGKAPALASGSGQRQLSMQRNHPRTPVVGSSGVRVLRPLELVGTTPWKGREKRVRD